MKPWPPDVATRHERLVGFLAARKGDDLDHIDAIHDVGVLADLAGQTVHLREALEAYIEHGPHGLSIKQAKDLLTAPENVENPRQTSV